MLRVVLLSLAAQAGASTTAVDFDRDVRPILSDRCFACHGPDAGAREADLRLDTREAATTDLGGYAAIVPGSASTSELWARVTAESAEERMPPPDAHRPPLEQHELRVLREWIEGGAPWARHWAFVPPVRASTPEGAHPVDALLARALEDQGLALAPRAATHTLARRLAFDLTGLPPTPSALAELGSTPDEERWSRYVEDLLASPHYGERMAMWWLDVARYADSDGFQQDEVRTNWPWRDWVVEAFQSGMPFDEFITQQLAGDLLPGAGEDQALATCFQRNHMHNGEGGRDPEESRVDYVRDRTNTLGKALLGLTLECAQCHDHKFDPVSQADYYALSAFFDSIDETGHAGGRAAPFLKLTSPLARPHLERAKRELEEAALVRERAAEASLGAGFEDWLDARREELLRGRETWSVLRPSAVASVEGSRVEVDASGLVRCTQSDAPQEDYHLRLDRAGIGLERVTGLRLEIPPGEGEGAPLSLAEDGEFIVTGVKLRVENARDGRQRDIELVGAAAEPVGQGVDEQYGAPRGLLDDDPRTGWTTRGQSTADGARVVLELDPALVLAEDEVAVLSVLQRSTVPGAQLRRLRFRATDQRGSVLRELGPAPLERLRDLKHDAPLPAELEAQLQAQFLEDDATWRDANQRVLRFEAQLAAARASTGELAVTVLRERAEPRVTRVLERGVWNAHGPVVKRGTPRGVFALPLPDSPTRLDLARWVTSRDQPLTARAIVNQVWQNLFGAGLVRTPSDLGLQGARPRYPELLDTLAVEFMETGWDVRHLLRLVVSSDTYRQSSQASAELLELDPRGELLARGPRFRLPSWMIRDAALAVSGLLERTVGGPPMYPHQPPGVWSDVFNGRFAYQPTLGRSRHRRTLYAFWRRNAAPTYLFDSADRRTCDVEARRTNTPLQALTLLNDETYLEAAAALAESELREAEGRLDDALFRMAFAVLQRPSPPREQELLRATLGRVRAEFRDDPDSAARLLEELEEREELEPRTETVDPPARAALVVLANLLLNLDEAVTHE